MVRFYAQLKYCHTHYNLILFRGGKTSQRIIQGGKVWNFQGGLFTAIKIMQRPFNGGDITFCFRTRHDARTIITTS